MYVSVCMEITCAWEIYKPEHTSIKKCVLLKVTTRFQADRLFILALVMGRSCSVIEKLVSLIVVEVLLM